MKMIQEWKMIQDYGFKIQDAPLAMNNEQFPQNVNSCKTRFGEIAHCSLQRGHLES